MQAEGLLVSPPWPMEGKAMSGLGTGDGRDKGPDGRKPLPRRKPHPWFIALFDGLLILILLTPITFLGLFAMAVGSRGLHRWCVNLIERILHNFGRDD